MQKSEQELCGNRLHLPWTLGHLLTLVSLQRNIYIDYLNCSLSSKLVYNIPVPKADPSLNPEENILFIPKQFFSTFTVCQVFSFPNYSQDHFITFISSIQTKLISGNIFFFHKSLFFSFSQTIFFSHFLWTKNNFQIPLCYIVYFFWKETFF